MTRNSKAKSGPVDSSKFTVAQDHTKTMLLQPGSSVDSTTFGASNKASTKAPTGTTTQRYNTRKSSKRSKKTKKSKVEKRTNDEGQNCTTSKVLKTVEGISTSTAPVPATSVSFLATKRETTNKAPTERAHVKKSQHEGLAAFTKCSKTSYTSDPTSGSAASNQALLDTHTEAPGSIPGKASTKPYGGVAQEVGSTSPLEQTAKSQSLSYAEVAAERRWRRLQLERTRRSMTSKRQHEIDADGFRLVRARRYRPSTKVPVRSAWERYCKRKNGNKHGRDNQRRTPAGPTPLYSGEEKVKSRGTLKETVAKTVVETVGMMVGTMEEETVEETVKKTIGAMVGVMEKETLGETLEENVVEAEFSARDNKSDEGIEAETGAETISYAYLMTIEATFREGVLTKVIVREAIVRETIAAERISTDLFFRETSATRRATAESTISEVFGPDISVPAIVAPDVLSSGEMRFEGLENLKSEEVTLERMASDTMASESIAREIVAFNTTVSDTLAPEITAIDSNAPAATNGQTNGQMWLTTKVALALMMLSAARDVFQVLFLVWQFAESI
ncbi:hypothetical protein JCM33374_g95 [Metschnikowia sp. JCM 33374]|nr:hypothetical protein JCM33374_g95 [Metschnikowia sp. JCM 33374]